MLSGARGPACLSKLNVGLGIPQNKTMLVQSGVVSRFEKSKFVIVSLHFLIGFITILNTVISKIDPHHECNGNSYHQMTLLSLRAQVKQSRATAGEYPAMLCLRTAKRNSKINIFLISGYSHFPFVSFYKLNVNR